MKILNFECKALYFTVKEKNRAGLLGRIQKKSKEIKIMNE